MDPAFSSNSFASPRGDHAHAASLSGHEQHHVVIPRKMYAGGGGNTNADKDAGIGVVISNAFDHPHYSGGYHMIVSLDATGSAAQTGKIRKFRFIALRHHAIVPAAKILPCCVAHDVLLSSCSLRLSAEVGDIIRSVNGEEMWGKSLAEYTDRLKGPNGSTVLSTCPHFLPARLVLLLGARQQSSERARCGGRWRLASCGQQHTQQRRRRVVVEVELRAGTMELPFLAQAQMPITCGLKEREREKMRCGEWL